MGKKRRVWWLGGASVALFGGLVALANYNSADARIERAVAQIVEEYGFELRLSSSGVGGLPQRALTSEIYSGAPMNAETADEIVAILREACPSCMYEKKGVDKDLFGTGGDPWTEGHYFRQEEEDGGWSGVIAFYADDKGLGDPDIEPVARLYLTTFERPSLWQRLKRLWPW